MSDIDNRKSMDDVLASIRRIVRSEKEPEDVSDTSAPAEPGHVPDSSDEPDIPLELTPDMRMDAEDTQSAAQASPTMEADDMPSEQELKSMIRDVLTEEMAGDQLGEYVRSVIRDELVNGEIGSNISQNVMTLIQSEVSNALNR